MNNGKETARAGEKIKLLGARTQAAIVAAALRARYWGWTNKTGLWAIVFSPVIALGAFYSFKLVWWAFHPAEQKHKFPLLFTLMLLFVIFFQTRRVLLGYIQTIKDARTAGLAAPERLAMEAKVQDARAKVRALEEAAALREIVAAGQKAGENGGETRKDPQKMRRRL
jgi:hypothetical protein